MDTRTRDDTQPLTVTTTPDRGGGRATVVPVAAWLVVVVSGATLVHVVLVATGEKRLDGVPLHAAFDPALSRGILLPLVVVAFVLIVEPRVRVLRWRPMLWSWWGLATVWAVALAASRGVHRVRASLDHDGEYLAVLSRVSEPGAFLAEFVDRLPSYPTHVQGHPPGFVLVAWSLRAVGAGGSLWLALLVVVVGTVAVPLVLVCARDVVDEQWARRAAPFLAIGPCAIWLATSADAFFTGVGALAVTLLVLASGSDRRRRIPLAAAGGLVMGCCLLLSYGLVLLALVPLAVLIVRRARLVLGVAGAATLTVLGATTAAGFWWPDGLRATHDRYAAGIASRRPYELFLIVNVAILCLAIGPAIAVALARLRDARAWLLVGGALGAVALADVSGMSKSEVERIWLPFMPYLLLSAGVFDADAGRAVRRLGPATGWLALQALVAIVIESVVRTAW